MNASYASPSSKIARLIHPESGVKVDATIKYNSSKEPVQIKYDDGRIVNEEEYIKYLLDQTEKNQNEENN